MESVFSARDSSSLPLHGVLPEDVHQEQGCDGSANPLSQEPLLLMSESPGGTFASLNGLACSRASKLLLAAQATWRHLALFCPLPTLCWCVQI
jgi:hypothetical protein